MTSSASGGPRPCGSKSHQRCNDFFRGEEGVMESSRHWGGFRDDTKKVFTQRREYDRYRRKEGQKRDKKEAVIGATRF